jgi:hypothetical protein
MKSFQIVFNDPGRQSIYMMVESPYYPEIEPILQRLNETVQKPCEWKLHRTFIDGKEVEA